MMEMGLRGSRVVVVIVERERERERVETDGCDGVCWGWD